MSVADAAVELPALKGVPRELMQLQPWRWFAAAAIDWVAIIAVFMGFYLLGTPWYLVPVAALLIGCRQHALALLGHDAAHYLIMRNRWWNDLFGHLLISWPLLICIEHGYRPWHWDHHRDLGTDDDPELHYRHARIYTDCVTWPRVIRLFIGDLLGLGILDAIGFLRESFPHQRKIAFLGPLAFWAIGIAVFCALGLWWVPALWAWSLMTGFYAVFRVRTYTEHVGVPAAGKATSHRFTAGPLARFFFVPHNTWCHYEHHKWAQVPFYNLPKLRALDGSKPVVRLSEIFPWR